MTDEELKRGKAMLVEAFELRVEAAAKYVEALEYILPLVDGDPENLRDARRNWGFCERFKKSVQANLRDATPEDVAETFKVFAKERESWE